MKTGAVVRSLIFFVFLTFFFSCSNSVPQVVKQRTILLFDFSEGSPPRQRLSVFVEPSSEIARIREISIEYPKDGLVWKLGEPDFITLDKGVWAGSSHLVMQKPRNFPAGEYRLTLTDYNGKSAVSAFKLEYPEKLARAESSSVEKTGNYPDLTRRFVIMYGDDSEMLSIDSASTDTTNPERIKKRFPQARSTQLYIEADKKNYAVLLPVQAIK